MLDRFNYFRCIVGFRRWIRIPRCRDLLLYLALVVLPGCHHSRVASSAPPVAPASATTPDLLADSIALIQVKQVHGDALQRGSPVDMLVELRYTLAARDRAFLTLSLEQFPIRETCASSLEGGSVAVVLTPVMKEIPIVRGTHALEIPITWPGDTGEGTNGRVFGAGTISFRAAMRIDRPNYQFLTRNFGTEYCVRF